jgi:hypothetical protein
MITGVDAPKPGEGRSHPMQTAHECHQPIMQKVKAIVELGCHINVQAKFAVPSWEKR